MNICIYQKNVVLLQKYLNVKLLKFETYEVYDVHMVIDAKDSVGTLTQEFVYNERAIPEINEPTNYNK